MAELTQGEMAELSILMAAINEGFSALAAVPCRVDPVAVEVRSVECRTRIREVVAPYGMDARGLAEVGRQLDALGTVPTPLDWVHQVNRWIKEHTA